MHVVYTEVTIQMIPKYFLIFQNNIITNIEQTTRMVVGCMLQTDDCSCTQSCVFCRVFGHGTVFPQLQGSSKVAQYITELQEFIEDRIEMLDNGVTKRKAYIEELVSQFEG